MSKLPAWDDEITIRYGQMRVLDNLLEVRENEIKDGLNTMRIIRSDLLTRCGLDPLPMLRVVECDDNGRVLDSEIEYKPES